MGRSKKTVKQLDEELQSFKARAGNAHVYGHVVWNLEQLASVLSNYDSDNGIIKAEITHGFEPGKKCYHVTIWRYPPIGESLTK